MRKLLSLVFLLTSLTLAAQHTISGTMQGENNRIVTLFAYTGQEKLAVDSTVTNHQGSFFFDDYLQTGMYVVETEEVGLELLYDGHRIQFIEHSPDNIQFFDSPLNERWTAYIMKRSEFRHNSEVLKQVLRQYDPESAFYATARDEFIELQENFNVFCDSLTQANDYASRLIKVDRPITIDPNTTVEEQRDLVLAHFFDNVDFNDTTLIPTNVLTTKMIDFISVVQADTRLSQDPEMRMVLALSRIFELAKVNFTTYYFALEYMLRGYSMIGMSTVTDYLLNYPALNEGDITVEQGRKLDAIAEPYQKVRAGAKAPNISQTTIDGKNVNLYSLDNEYVILFFWAVDCPYCHNFLNKIRKKLNLDRFCLLTFAIANNVDEVRNELSGMKLKGFHFFDETRWESEVVKDYHVFATPTVYVLDRSKTIVCKPNDWTELELWLKKNAAQ